MHCRNPLVVSLTVLLISAGCVGWVPAEREVALRSAPARQLRVTNATTQPIALLATPDHPNEADLRIAPGESATIRFGLYRLIRAKLLRGTPEGWRADTADEARLALVDEGPGHYLDMDGPEAAFRVRSPGADDPWRFRISLGDCLFDAQPAGGAFEVKVEGAPSVLVPVELCP